MQNSRSEQATKITEPNNGEHKSNDADDVKEEQPAHGWDGNRRATSNYSTFATHATLQTKHVPQFLRLQLP
jgi:hypothetical protein